MRFPPPSLFPMSPFFFFTLLFSLLLLFLPFSSPSRSSPCPYYPTHTILGVQHSGTTTVHGMLEKCVDLCYVKKELHVLDKLRVLDIRLLYQEEEKVCEKYKSLISTNKTKNCLAIDISPSYAVSTVASQYFSQYLPNIKQAVILREPLDRVLSVMNHRCCNKLSNKLSVESSKAAVLEGIHEDYLKFVETYSHTEVIFFFCFWLCFSLFCFCFVFFSFLTKKNSPSLSHKRKQENLVFKNSNRQLLPKVGMICCITLSILTLKKGKACGCLMN